MSDDFSSDHDDHIVGRLRAIGDEPVDPVVTSQHLTAMAALGAAPRKQKRFGRVAVAGAAITGFMFGGLGLGWANALPGPAQGVAENVLEFVQIDGPWKNRGECISTQARANPTDEAAKAAAKQECPRGGKPEGVGRPDGVGGQGKANAHAGDPCRGAPSWAGRGSGPTAEEQGAHEQQRAACGPDAAGVEAREAEAPEVQEQEIQEQELETTDTSAPVTQETTDTSVSVTEDTGPTTEDTDPTTEDTTGTEAGS